MAELKPYQRLAPHYHKAWTSFVRQYVGLVHRLAISPSASGATAIDLACGTGVLLAELAKMGYRITGLDISEEMISIAKLVCPNGKYIKSDVRDMQLEEAFDLITWTFDSLNYILALEEVGNVFNNVARHLKADGRFLFDVNTPYKYEDRQHGTIHRSVDGYEFNQVLEYDMNSRISTTVFEFNDGMREVHLQKLYTQLEIIKSLQDNGLGLVRCFADFELSTATISSPRIYFLA